jgi:hypothetical protein
MDGAFEAQVRQRAYEIWLDLGRADGQAHDHWIAAERDLLAQPAKPKTARVGDSQATTAARKTGKAPAAKLTKTKKVARAAEPSGASV